MCHLLISNTNSTVFIKSFLITSALTHLTPSLPTISIATAFGLLTVATWPGKQCTCVIPFVPLNTPVS